MHFNSKSKTKSIPDPALNMFKERSKSTEKTNPFEMAPSVKVMSNKHSFIISADDQSNPTTHNLDQVFVPARKSILLQLKD